MRWGGHTTAPRGDPRRPEASLGGSYLLGLGAELRTPGRRAPRRPSLPGSQTFHSAPWKGRASILPPSTFQRWNLSKLPRDWGGRGAVRSSLPLASGPSGGLRMLGTQEWGKQPDGHPRTRPKFPPKLLRPRRDPEAVTSTGSGEPSGWERRVKQAPGHQPQGHCGARPRGQRAGARPLPQPGGGAAPSTQPLPAPQRGAEPGTRGSLSLGPRSSRGTLATSPGRTASPPGPPPRERQRARAQGGRLPAPLSSSDRCISGELRSLHPGPPPPAAAHSLSTLLSYLADRQTGDTKKKGRGGRKKKLPPLLLPSSSLEPREEEGEHVFPPPLHPDSATRVDRAARSPEVA